MGGNRSLHVGAGGALALLLGACDGTLSGLHRTRGEVPVLYAAPVASAEVAASKEPKEIRAQHILVMHRDSKRAPATITRSRDEAKERAEEALAKLRSGSSFDEIAAAYSDEPGAADRGGDLGKFKKKMMVPRFSDVAFRLDVAQLSDVVETEFGFHVIRRTE